MAGPLGGKSNSPDIDAGTLSRARARPSGAIGIAHSAPGKAGSRSAATPFLIQLDLTELVRLDEPGVGKVSQSGSLRQVDVFVKAGVISNDPGRPKRVLSIVQDLFKPLRREVRIELDTPASSDRLLRVSFGWPMMTKSGQPQTSKKYGQFYDPSFVGAGAQSSSRTRVEKFKPVKGDAGKGVTAYVFEGAVGVVVQDFFSGKVNVDAIFATAIAHELGHNLGLKHTESPTDIMFVYAGHTEQEQKRWMSAAEKKALRFSATQISAMRKLIRKP